MISGRVRPAGIYDLDAARSVLSGQRAFFFFGFNDLVGAGGTSVWTDIWPANTNINWLTTAGQIEITSTDAADTSDGAGVRSVEVHGLDANGNDQDEIIVLSGLTTTTATTLTYIRVNKMHSETCGTYGGSHQGDITCNLKTGGVLLAKMTGEEGGADTSVVYGSGESGNGFWTVPLGKVMYITRLEVITDVGANKSVTVVLYERENILDTSAPVAPRRVIWQESGVDEATEKVFKSHIKIKGLTDIWFRARADTTSKVEVSLDFYLLDANASGA